ncbi:hypothetical protein [Sphaerimonospora mesophila]|uniref:hypothetical protein n=1 Tax=Sphaerimonospora mesophila TaxID=37483 RepID=UPI001F1CB474
MAGTFVIGDRAVGHRTISERRTYDQAAQEPLETGPVTTAVLDGTRGDLVQIARQHER